MAEVTRRHVLAGLSGVTLGSLVASPATAADPPAEGAPLLFGPFAIDKWFLKVVESSPLGGPLEPLSTPKHEDVAKVLAACRVYVIDRRAGPAGKGARFAKDGYPLVVAGGKLSGEWRDGKTTYVLHVDELSILGTHTGYDVEPAYRELGRLHVAFHLRGSDGRGSADAVYNFSSDRPLIAYDITGAVRPR